MALIARLILVLAGAALVAAGVIRVCDAREGALRWLEGLFSAGVGLLFVGEAVFGKAEHLRELLRTSWRMRVGALLVAAGLLVFAFARLFRWSLTGTPRGLAIAAVVVGAFILFFDL
jgi:hypothetical protein